MALSPTELTAHNDQDYTTIAVILQVMNKNWGIIGHNWIVKSLQRAVATDTVSHAYLFTGPPGVGKTTLARKLAEALLCEAEDVRERPCGQCRACRLVKSDGHPDLHVVESEHVGASLKIAQVRELEHQLNLTPVEGRRRVAILRRFEEATTSAANALLKTLEEPPPYAVLMVLAQDADVLLSTIVSRCQQIQLHPLSLPMVEQALVERWDADPEKANLLAHLSSGRLGWAVRTLTDKSALKRRSERLIELDELISGSIVERFQYAEELARDAIETEETISLWTGWWRDVLLVASGAKASLSNVDRRHKLRDHARRFGLEKSAAMLKALRSASEKLKRNANARLTLEVLMLDLPRS